MQSFYVTFMSTVSSVSVHLYSLKINKKEKEKETEHLLPLFDR